MKTKALNCDVVLSGGGPAGSSLALILARAGLSVVLIDPEPPVVIDKPTGRTAALLNTSINVLKAAGLWDDLKDNVTPLKTMRIADAHDEGTGVTFYADEINADQFGFNIPNAVLKSAALTRIQNTESMTLLTDKLQDYVVDGARVIATTEGGITINAGLIVGTDGRGSRVRTIAGIDVDTHDYGQSAMTCLITHTGPHHFTSTEFHRSGGPFTFVPMPGNQSSVVWVEKTEDAKKFIAMKKQDFEQALQDRSQGLLGTISLASTPECWPLMYLSSDCVTGNRAAIAAEAAHVMSPLGAQGLNLSLRDVAGLAETIIDAARLGEDIGGELVLARYEKRRHLDLVTRTKGIDAYNKLVAHDFSFLQDLRRLGIKGLDKIAPIKHLAMEHGLAPTVDDGRILRGQAV